MSEKQPEALRLVSELIDAAHGTVMYEDQSREDEARAALLAHIKRGAVPEGYVAVPRFLAENHRNLTDVPRHQRILDDCLAAAPDQFRDAAKMMAAPAEVPMPEPDYRGPAEAGTYFNGYTHMTLSTYGAACRAAGYARGVAEAGRDVERYRWLRDFKFKYNGHCLALSGPILWEESLDAAIDAVLRGEVKP